MSSELTRLLNEVVAFANKQGVTNNQPNAFFIITSRCSDCGEKIYLNDPGTCGEHRPVEEPGLDDFIIDHIPPNVICHNEGCISSNETLTKDSQSLTNQTPLQAKRLDVPIKPHLKPRMDIWASVRKGYKRR